jgi:hypothetical protein
MHPYHIGYPQPPPSHTNIWTGLVSIFLARRVAKHEALTTQKIFTSRRLHAHIRICHEHLALYFYLWGYRLFEPTPLATARTHTRLVGGHPFLGLGYSATFLATARTHTRLVSGSCAGSSSFLGFRLFCGLHMTCFKQFSLVL